MFFESILSKRDLPVGLVTTAIVGILTRSAFFARTSFVDGETATVEFIHQFNPPAGHRPERFVYLDIWWEFPVHRVIVLRLQSSHQIKFLLQRSNIIIIAPFEYALGFIVSLHKLLQTHAPYYFPIDTP